MGKIVATYLVRVTIRATEDPGSVPPTPDEVPTNDRLAEVIKEALYSATDLLKDEIHVESERTDI